MVVEQGGAEGMALGKKRVSRYYIGLSAMRRDVLQLQTHSSSGIGWA